MPGKNLLNRASLRWYLGGKIALSWTNMMNAVTCPRCRQDWLSDDQPEGSERLCSTCVTDLHTASHDADALRSRPALRKQRIALPYFRLYVALLMGIDLIVIGLALLLPHSCARYASSLAASNGSWHMCL